MKLYRYLYFLLNIFLPIAPALGQSQDIRVETGKTELRPGEPFEIKVFIRYPRERPEVVFPNLNGMEKGSSTRVRTTLALGEKNVPKEILTQQYIPDTSQLLVERFEVIVNNTRYPLPGFMLRIDEELTDSLALVPGLAIDEHFNEPLEREDVFLSVRPTKKNVFIREGFGLYLSLFVAKDVKLTMEFHELDRQLHSISQLLKPDGCWEENTWIDEIVPRLVTIRNRDYTEYRLFQSVFFPLIEKTVSIPAISLTMNMGEEKESLKTFYSRPVTIGVKPLPPHPRQDQVAVGSFSLVESISSAQVNIGNPFTYRFGVSGSGNITAIPAPATIPVQTFEFYPPEVSMHSHPHLKNVSGTKNFEYTLVAMQQGLYPLKGYFQWIYFDVDRAVYDTLRSDLTVDVTGTTTKKSDNMVAMGENRLYANLERLNSASVHRNYDGIFRNVMNVVVILMLGSVLWLFRK